MLGRFEINKIYNEDCYKAIKDIPDKSIDLVYIDPPYQFIKGGESKSEIGQRKMKHNKELSFISDGFANEILEEICRVCKKIYVYIWCSKNQLRQILDYFDDKECFIDLLTWHKTNPIPVCNGIYLNDTEYCVLAREKGTKIYGNVDTKKKYYISSTNKDDKDKFSHPTIKPLECVKNHIFNSTQEGDIVLDCFMGSGTTAIACRQLNRNFIGFELDTKFYNIACDRLKGVTVQERKNNQISLFDFLEEE